MASLPREPLTPELYLEFDRSAQTRSEYLSGEMFAMAGNTREHVEIVVNLVGELRTTLKSSDCKTYATEMRVKASETSYLYPDIAIVCSEAQFLDGSFDTLLNPLVIVEVLSKSTEAFDRGEKFNRYRSISSVKQYVLVSTVSQHVEWFSRGPDGRWWFDEAAGLESVLALPSIDCQVPLSEIYDRVVFDGKAEAASGLPYA